MDRKVNLKLSRLFQPVGPGDARLRMRRPTQAGPGMMVPPLLVVQVGLVSPEAWPVLISVSCVQVEYQVLRVSESLSFGDCFRHQIGHV